MQESGKTPAPSGAAPSAASPPATSGAAGARARLGRAGVVAASAAMVLGLLVLVVGWGFGVYLLRSGLPGGVHMRPLTATGLFCAGLGLLLLTTAPARAGRAAALLGALTAFLGAVVGAEYVFDLRLGFERVLFPGALAEIPADRPGLPAPNTGLGFFLIGTGLFILSVRRRAAGWAQVLGLAAGFVALQAVIGYAYGAESLYRLGAMPPMALPTAVGFLLLAGGMVCAQPDRGFAGQVTAADAGGFVARALLPAALLLPLALGWLALHAVRSGHMTLETGVAFLVVCAIFAVSGAIWASTRLLSAADRRQRAERAAARQFADRVAQAVELSPFPTIIHAEDGTVLQVSRRWTKLSGYTLPEIPTMDAWVEKVHGQDAQVARARIATLFDITETVTEEQEYAIRAKDGQTRTWSFSSAPLGRLPDGRRILISVAADVTERTRTERELRRTNEQLSFLFAATSRLLASRDPAELLRPLHGELGGLLGLEVFVRYEVDTGPGGLRLAECVGLEPEAAGLLRALGPAAIPCAAGEQRQPVVLEDIGGADGGGVEHNGAAGHGARACLHELGITAYVCHPLVARDELVGAMAFGTRRRPHFAAGELELLQAIADQVVLAAERASAYAAEQRAREQAEDASRAKDQFMAVVSHELRTPLTAVVGYADLLDADVEGTLSEAHRRFVHRIRESAWSLASVIDEILTFARTRAGREHVSAELVNVTAVAAQAVAAMQPEVQKKRLRLVVRLPETPLKTRTDPAKVRRILLNLLGNAVKFTEEGEVELALHPDGDRLRFLVRDTGPGIPAEYLESIFDPFVQVDSSETRTQSGTGLGLTITRELAFLLGGTVSVDSTVGAGSTFTVDLPVERE
jgi:PAS domain S-box-containing protein